MGQAEKSHYYQALKAAGVKFDQHYRHYTEQELKEAWEELPSEMQGEAVKEPLEKPQVPKSNIPIDKLAGMRTNLDEEVIRVDDKGRQWLQEEVRKSAIPKPRARRKLQYVETGIEEVTVKNGEYTETFEIAGDSNTVSEVRITLPTYQVGKYIDPRFPFPVHIYNEQTGFDLFAVEDFYGGRELVPQDVKRVYVDSVLCYDIPSVINAIQSEARRIQLGIPTGAM